MHYAPSDRIEEAVLEDKVQEIEERCGMIAKFGWKNFRSSHSKNNFKKNKQINFFVLI